LDDLACTPKETPIKSPPIAITKRILAKKIKNDEISPFSI
jgi:hypothetical protein